MHAEQVKKAHAQTPFRPFTLFLSDQRRFEVQHPEYLWIIPGGRTVAVADEAGAVELIDLVHVSSLRLSTSDAA